MRASEALSYEPAASWRRLQESKEFFFEDLDAHMKEQHQRFLEGLMGYERKCFLKQLTQAAEGELAFRKNFNDPPYYPRVLYNVLGEIRLNRGEHRQAIAAFEAAMASVRNDAIALAGLAQAHAALGNKAQATEYYARLLHVWSMPIPACAGRKRRRDSG